MTEAAAQLDGFPHDEMLTLLARSAAGQIKTLAETMLPELGEITVHQNRTGLVMLPMRDTAKGTHFHLGEVLVSEARITAGGQEGYGMRRGRDLEAAMAMAVIDLAVALGRTHGAVIRFLTDQRDLQQTEDRETLCRVEATRVDMETF